MKNSSFPSLPRPKLLKLAKSGGRSMWGAAMAEFGYHLHKENFSMSGYLMLGDIKGKSGPAFLKLGDIKGEVTALPSDSKNRLRQMGLSIQGISQLESGKLITNQKDMRIIAHIVSSTV